MTFSNLTMRHSVNGDDYEVLVWQVTVISIIDGSAGLPIFIYSFRVFRHRQALLLAQRSLL